RHHSEDVVVRASNSPKGLADRRGECRARLRQKLWRTLDRVAYSRGKVRQEDDPVTDGLRCSTGDGTKADLRPRQGCMSGSCVGGPLWHVVRRLGQWRGPDGLSAVFRPSQESSVKLVRRAPCQSLGCSHRNPTSTVEFTI